MRGRSRSQGCVWKSGVGLGVRGGSGSEGWVWK